MHEVTGINQAENRPVSIQLEFEVYRIGIRHHDIQDILTIKLLEFIPMVMEQDGNAIVCAKLCQLVQRFASSQQLILGIKGNMRDGTGT